MNKTCNDGETAFGNTEPFICDICCEEAIRMFELGGIQVCQKCYKEEVAEDRLDCREICYHGDNPDGGFCYMYKIRPNGCCHDLDRKMTSIQAGM